MSEGSYRQFCPVAMAAEILCTRWTMLILRELMAGSTRFNELRRGAPRMSPALLSQRLKELEAADVVCRRPSQSDSGVMEYHLTDAGRELEPVLMALGKWGHKWIAPELALDQLDASLLMWDVRRRIDPQPLPHRRNVVQVQFPEQTSAKRFWWLLIEPQYGVDLCYRDPGFDVDLYITADLKTMTAVWMGYESVASAVRGDRLVFTGDRALAASVERWLGRSAFAPAMAEAV